MKIIFSAVIAAVEFAWPSNQDDRLGREIEAAAVAVFLLAACRLVPGLDHNYILKASNHEPVICALIAAVLDGGELHLSAGDRASHPRVKGIHHLDKLAPGTDRPASHFHRQVYNYVYRADAAGHEHNTLDAEPLTDDETHQLEVRLFRRRYQTNPHSLAFVVPNVAEGGHYEAFASAHKVTVFLPDLDAAPIVLEGMTPEYLIAWINELKETFEKLRARSAPTSGPAGTGGKAAMPDPSTPSGAISGGGTGNTTHVTVGPGGIVQIGDRATAQIKHREGVADPAALLPLLQALRQAIHEQADIQAATRGKLAENADKALAEAGKKDGGDLAVVEKALDRVKTVAEAVDRGETILAKCKPAYNLVATLAGLPPWP